MTDIPADLFVPAAGPPTHWNVVLYGPAKAGKSTGASTAPGPHMWLNLEGGGALGFPRMKAAELGGAIHEVRISPDEDPRIKIREAIKHVRSGAEPVVQTIVLDTIGKLRDNLSRRLVVKGSKNSMQQWGDVGDAIEAIVLTLRDLPVHVVILAHEDISEGDGEGRIVKPLIGGKTTEKVLGEVDIISYIGPVQYDDGVKYMGQLVEARGRRAGDRSNGLGTMREIDLTEWFAIATAALTPAVDPDLPWDQSEERVASDDPVAEIDTSDMDPLATPEIDPDDEHLQRILDETFGDGVAAVES